jgi:excinuclease ABC subunit C
MAAEAKSGNEAPAVAGGLAQGMAAIAAAVKTLPGTPGVYRMLDRKGEALYVGKAKNLKKRVTTYTQADRLPRRLQRMVAATVGLEVITTHTEIEALLLESNLIKRFLPRYNVLLRDDKSFPYIRIDGEHDYPEISKHRGARNRPGDYYGPFASAGAVNRTITALEKAFLLRSCSDSVFASRTRPCLMHQIKRCAAPCVGRVSKQDYSELVNQARDFLTGRSHEVQQGLAASMEGASERLDFETAAVYRDRIRALAHIQSRQDINLSALGDADVIAAHREAEQTCIQVFFFRAGRNYGNRAYYPSHDKELGPETVLGAFIVQFYENKPVPGSILVSHEPEDAALIAEALAYHAGHKVGILAPKRAQAQAGRPRPRQRPRRPGAAPGREQRPARSARGPGRSPRTGSGARAHRDLRQQPHRRRQSLWRHGRRRAPGSGQERLPQVSHQGRGEERHERRHRLRAR